MRTEYIAGFFDGEGWLGIYPKSARMGFSNLNRGVLEAIQAELGGHGRIRTSTSGVYYLEIGSIGMREVLPRLIPHLIVKRRLAELVYEYLTGITTRGGFGTPAPDDDELARRRRIRDEVRAINESRGRLAWGHARGV